MPLITKTLEEIKSENIAIDVNNFTIIDAISLQKEVNEFYPCEVRVKFAENINSVLAFHSVSVCLINPTTETRIHKVHRSGKIHYNIYSSDIEHDICFKNVSRYQKQNAISGIEIPKTIGKLTTKKIQQWIDYINQCFVLIDAENSANTSELDAFLDSIKDQEVRWFNDKKSGEIIKNGIKFSFKIEEGCISKKIEVYDKVKNNIENFLKLADNKYKGA